MPETQLIKTISSAYYIHVRSPGRGGQWINLANVAFIQEMENPDRIKIVYSDMAGTQMFTDPERSQILSVLQDIKHNDLPNTSEDLTHE